MGVLEIIHGYPISTLQGHFFAKMELFAIGTRLKRTLDPGSNMTLIASKLRKGYIFLVNAVVRVFWDIFGQGCAENLV